MIYEMRVHTFKSKDDSNGFEQSMMKAIPHRNKYSPFTAYWKTETGPPYQSFPIWPYENLMKRARIRANAESDPHWPPEFSGVADEISVEILLPAPFMRPHWGETLELGNIYEMCIDRYKPGSLAEVIKLWGANLPNREKLSPLAACWSTEFGPQVTWIHVWPYVNHVERERIRIEAAQKLYWPPQMKDLMLSQESKILVPAPFSPMR
jgi:hypothetical protein